jgi:hypothetical protein
VTRLIAAPCRLYCHLACDERRSVFRVGDPAVHHRRAHCDQLCDSPDKTAGRLDGGRGLFQRDDGVRACLVVGNGFQLLPLREKAPQLEINAGLVGDQFQKLAVISSMGLGQVGPLKDEG